MLCVDGPFQPAAVFAQLERAFVHNFGVGSVNALAPKDQRWFFCMFAAVVLNYDRVHAVHCKVKHAARRFKYGLYVGHARTIQRWWCDLSYRPGGPAAKRARVHFYVAAGAKGASVS